MKSFKRPWNYALSLNPFLIHQEFYLPDQTETSSPVPARTRIRENGSLRSFSGCRLDPSIDLFPLLLLLPPFQDRPRTQDRNSMHRNLNLEILKIHRIVRLLLVRVSEFLEEDVERFVV